VALLIYAAVVSFKKTSLVVSQRLEGRGKIFNCTVFCFSLGEVPEEDKGTVLSSASL
jgi:hypothetical protein